MDPPYQIHAGERLTADLTHLHEYGYTCYFDLTTTNPDNLVMDQLFSAVHTMTYEGSLEFPPFQPEPLDLGPNELNWELQILFNCLPFQILKTGNKTANRQYIKIEQDLVYHDFEHHKIVKCLE